MASVLAVGCDDNAEEQGKEEQAEDEDNNDNDATFEAVKLLPFHRKTLNLN